MSGAAFAALPFRFSTFSFQPVQSSSPGVKYGSSPSDFRGSAAFACR